MTTQSPIAAGFLWCDALGGMTFAAPVAVEWHTDADGETFCRVADLFHGNGWAALEADAESVRRLIVEADDAALTGDALALKRKIKGMMKP